MKRSRESESNMAGNQQAEKPATLYTPRDCRSVPVSDAVCDWSNHLLSGKVEAKAAYWLQPTLSAAAPKLMRLTMQGSRSNKTSRHLSTWIKVFTSHTFISLLRPHAPKDTPPTPPPAALLKPQHHRRAQVAQQPLSADI